MMKSPWLLATALSILSVSLCDGARFAVVGPVLTVTLKDPATGESGNKWLNLDNFRPNFHWSVRSQSKPLPNWLPSLQSLRANVGYQYDDLKRMPSFVEADLQFKTKPVDLQIQPTYEFRSKRSVWLVQASRGHAYVMTKLVFGREKWLELVRGCYQLDLPYASVGAVRVTPSWDFRKEEPSCVLEGVTGSQRTKAVLNLDYQNPTLSVVHALDERYVKTNK
jgi:hypothetical protein